MDKIKILFSLKKGMRGKGRIDTFHLGKVKALPKVKLKPSPASCPQSQQRHAQRGKDPEHIDTPTFP